MEKQQFSKLLRLAQTLDGPEVTGQSHQIASCRQALELVYKDIHPRLWASLQSILAHNLIRATSGNRAENLEQAITILHRVLEIFTHDTMPKAWAEANNGLGMAYSNRWRGDKTKNWEKSVAYYQLALEVRTREAMPVGWAETTDLLATGYLDNPQGDRAENIELAINTYRQALEVRTRQAMPKQWAITTGNLAHALANSLKGERAKNLEQAIKGYKQALSIITQQNYPFEWANLMTNRANAYAERIYGDRAENLEFAIQDYQHTLKIRTRESMQVEWAHTMNNLAAAYHERLRGNRADNLEQALEHYQQALKIRTRQDMPQEWAETTNNLATIYSDRIHGNRAKNLELALQAYQQALEIWTCDSAPIDWATTMGNLASIYSELRCGNLADNLEKSLECCQQALQVRKRQTMHFPWATTMMGLGNAYAARLKGERSDNLKQAIAAYHEALEVHSLAAAPAEHRRTQGNLGDLYFDDQHWQLAYKAYAAALEAGERLYESGITPDSRLSELKANSDFSTRAAYCLARLGDFTAAVETIEQGKTRTISEVLARNEAQFKNLSEADQAAFKHVSQHLNVLEAKARALGQQNIQDFLTISEECRTARQQLSQIVERIRADVPEFMPVGLDFPNIVSVAKNYPLVYLLTTPHSSLALLVTPQTMSHKQVIWLNDLTTADLNNILYNRDNVSRYLHGIVSDDTEILQHVLDEIWPIITEHLMMPITQCLQQLGYQQAVLIPSGTLGLLPLHSMTDQTVVFSVLPSARTLQTALIAAQQRTKLPRHLLGIGNPSNAEVPLPFTRLAVEEVALLFSTERRQVFYERKATRAVLLNALPSTTDLFFSCHGNFDLNNPLASALALAKQDTLTLRDLLDGEANLSTVRLTVLSACQTGITDFQNVPDEAIGFPSGFIQAGVPGIISTLWPVADISTALLLMCFYHYYLIDNLPPAQALQQAQRWLCALTAQEVADSCQIFYEKYHKKNKQIYRAIRHYRTKGEQRVFAHPYYWAGFVFSGV